MIFWFLNLSGTRRTSGITIKRVSVKIEGPALYDKNNANDETVAKPQSLGHSRVHTNRKTWKNIVWKRHTNQRQKNGDRLVQHKLFCPSGLALFATLFPSWSRGRKIQERAPPRLQFDPQKGKHLILNRTSPLKHTCQFSKNIGKHFGFKLHLGFAMAGPAHCKVGCVRCSPRRGIQESINQLVD